MTIRKPPESAEVPTALKAAVQDLVANVGGEGFLMELQTDDGQRYYLAFGKAGMIRDLVDSLPGTPPADDLPSIH